MGGITIPDFKLYYRIIVIKTAWYWQKNRHEVQCNRIEDQDANPHSYSHLIFDKRAQNMHWRKGSFFNKWCWENLISTCRRLKLDPSLSFCISTNLKWIKVLNVRSETLKLLQKRTGNTLEQVGIRNNFLNSNSSATKRKDWQVGLHQIKSFCTAKEEVTRLKR
jgi:hypothetical protein